MILTAKNINRNKYATTKLPLVFAAGVFVFFFGGLRRFEEMIIGLCLFYFSHSF